MSRPGIAQDEVVRVAVRLLSQGKSPSVRNVWRGLGERGSFETISKHLEAWRGSLSEASLDVLPPPLPAALMEPLEALWTVAVQEASSQYADARASAETALAQAQTAAQDAEQAAEAARAKAGELSTDLARQTEALHAAQARIEELAAQLRVRESEIGQLRQEQAQERHIHEERLRLLQVDATRQQCAHEEKVNALEARVQDEITRAEAQERHWLRLLDEARAQAKAVERRADSREQELVAQLTQRSEQIEAALAQRLAAEARLEALTNERDRLVDQNEALTRRWQREAAQRQADQQMCQQRLRAIWQRALEHAEQVLTVKRQTKRDKLEQLRILKEHPPVPDTPVGDLD